MSEKAIDRLRRAQAQRGLSDTRTAQLLGISKQRYTNWKTRGIPPRELKRAADFCGITIDELIGRPAPSRPSAKEEGRVRVHGYMVTPEEVEFGIEWGKLDEPERSTVQMQVLLMVAEQQRRKRRTDRQRPPTSPPAE